MGRPSIEEENEQLRNRIQELEAEVAIAWDDDAETKRAEAAEAELEDLRGRVERAEEALKLVRVQVSPHRIDAFKPETDDQATNAGRFAVAMYLIQQIAAVVFPAQSRSERKYREAVEDEQEGRS